MPTENDGTLTDERVDRQHSAGGLVVRGEEVLLISTQYGNRWQLPKGHLEPGETSRVAAAREVFEETGIRGDVRELLGTVEFDFKSRAGVRILKQVDYYLLDFLGGDESNFDPAEVTEARWLPWNTAILRLTFDNERVLVEEAHRLVEAKNET